MAKSRSNAHSSAASFSEQVADHFTRHTAICSGVTGTSGFAGRWP